MIRHPFVGAFFMLSIFEYCAPLDSKFATPVCILILQYE